MDRTAPGNEGTDNVRRTPRITAVVLAALVAFGAPALAATDRAAEAPATTVDAALEDQLAGVGSDAVLTLIVHGTSFDAVATAVRDAGMATVANFPLVDAMATAGTADQIAVLASSAGITHLEADEPLEYLGGTSHDATRGRELIAGYDITVEDTSTSTRHVQADGAGVSIAIIDSGVDGTHPMFAELDDQGQPTDVSRVVVNKKFAPLCAVTFDSEALPGSEPLPCFGPAGDSYFDPENQASVDVPGNDSDTPSAGGHGTHVASIAAGGPFTTDDGRTITGAAPEAKVVSLSAGAALSVAAATQAQYWVLENWQDPCGDGSCPPIRVVNNSYGPQGGGEFDATSATVKIQRLLAEQGVMMVWAAGNDGGAGTDNRSNPPGQDPTPGVLMVANYDDDGTGTRDGSLASSSSRGESTRQATWPDISAPGTDITAACRPYLAICSSGEGDAGTITGTSMAAPHVAGIVAQLFELVPDATAAKVENAIEDTAHQFSFGGAYYPDFRNADHTTSFDKGHGLIDAVAAANELLGLVEAPAKTDVPTCSADDVLIRDAVGDGFVSDAFLVNVDPGIEPPQEPESDPTVDLLTVDAVETTAGLDVVFDLAAFTGQPPEGKDGYRMHLQATIGEGTYFVAMSLSSDPTGAEPTVDYGIDVLDGNLYSEIIDLEGQTDAEAGTVTVHVTNAAIQTYNDDPARTRPEIPTLTTGTQLTGLAALTQTATSAVVVSSLADADAAAGQCAFEYGTGAVDASGPTETPDDNDSGVDADGEPVSEGDDGTDDGSIEPTLGGVDTKDQHTLAPGDEPYADGGFAPQTNIDHSCSGPEDPACLAYLLRIEGAGALTVSIEARTPVEDFDLVVYDGAGEELAVFGQPGTPPGGLEGGTVDVERGAYFVVVQPYLAEGTDGPTGGSGYILTATLN